MKIALIQQMAPEAAGYASTRQKIYALLREAAAKGAQLAVLPEMAFPSYFISQSDALREEALSQTRALLDDVAAIARELRLHIAVGYCEQADGGPYNSADFYDDEGTLLHTSRKSNMWHLDSLQFTPGQEYRAFDTKLGRIGLMICADGRVPEICRILALDGAALILDPVNLLGTASDPKDLANQQSAYILPVRALENRVWLVVANKVGLEAKCLRYLGRSMLIGPDGQIAVQASTDKEEVVVCEFDPSQDRGAPEAREPRLYKELTRPKAQTAAHELLSKALPGPDTLEVYTCTAQFSAGSHEAYLEKAAFHLNMCKWLMAGLVLFPAMKDDCDLLGTAKALMENMPPDMLAVLPGVHDGARAAVLFDKNKPLHIFYKTHGAYAAKDASLTVADTRRGRLGMMFGQEGLIPEVARVQALMGCDILLWADDAPRAMSRQLQQTRSAENKIFTVRSAPLAAGESVLITSPEGIVMCAAQTGDEQAVGATLFTAMSRAKTVVPGTNIISGRHESAYGRIC